MDFTHDAKTEALIEKLQAFMAAEIYPAEKEAHDWFFDPAKTWQPWPKLEELKRKAKE